jgi:hypothetical protein
MTGCRHYTVQQCSGTDRLNVLVISGLLVWWATAFGLGLGGVHFIAAQCTPQRVPISF